jgi:diacylglycerol kinase (ATP)
VSATAILNPYSNRWEAGRRASEVEAIMRQTGIDFELKITERSEHGIELAREAVEAGNTPLIAIGGDGAFSEVVNGLMLATPPNAMPAGPIGFMPMGTANDLTDVLGIPRDLHQAAQIIAAGRTRTIDLGTVNGRFFDNNSAVGLEPVVTIENIRLTWLRGVIRYLAAAVIAIMEHPKWKVQMEWDNGSYDGSITLVSVGNSRRTGGVFFMTPNAVMDDGLLDFVYAPALGRLRTFQLLPKTQTGAHVHEPEINEHRTTRLSIRIQPSTPIQADGELFSKEATEIVYQVIPGALRVFLP